MRFTVAEMLVIIVVVSLFAAANAFEREKVFHMRKGNRTIEMFRVTYYGFPFAAYWPEKDRDHFLPWGITLNSAIALGSSCLAVFLVRKFRQRFWRSPPTDGLPNA